jgi:hypothetical protein
MNEKCYNKNSQFVDKWKLCDIDSEYPRDYCYAAYKSFDLCSSCEEYLNLIKNTDPLILDIFQWQQNDINRIKVELCEMKEELCEIKKIIKMITHTT